MTILASDAAASASDLQGVGYRAGPLPSPPPAALAPVEASRRVLR
ncbi:MULTISPECIES: hypothetical protein [Protofrankia]|nr:MULTISPECIES: hypothetical protein [Protofrankia]